MAPPGPIPNPEVKHWRVDDSRTTGPAKVDRCQDQCSPQCPKPCGLLLLHIPSQSTKNLSPTPDLIFPILLDGGMRKEELQMVERVENQSNLPPRFLFYRGIRLLQSCDGKRLCLISEELSNFSFGVIYGSLAVFITRVFIHSIFQETSHHLLAVHTSCNN